MSTTTNSLVHTTQNGTLTLAIPMVKKNGQQFKVYFAAAACARIAKAWAHHHVDFWTALANFANDGIVQSGELMRQGTEFEHKPIMDVLFSPTDDQPLHIGQSKARLLYGLALSDSGSLWSALNMVGGSYTYTPKAATPVKAKKGRKPAKTGRKPKTVHVADTPVAAPVTLTPSASTQSGPAYRLELVKMLAASSDPQVKAAILAELRQAMAVTATV